MAWQIAKNTYTDIMHGRSKTIFLAARKPNRAHSQSQGDFILRHPALQSGVKKLLERTILNVVTKEKVLSILNLMIEKVPFPFGVIL